MSVCSASYVIAGEKIEYSFKFGMLGLSSGFEAGKKLYEIDNCGHWETDPYQVVGPDVEFAVKKKLGKMYVGGSIGLLYRKSSFGIEIATDRDNVFASMVEVGMENETDRIVHVFGDVGYQNRIMYLVTKLGLAHIDKKLCFNISKDYHPQEVDIHNIVFSKTIPMVGIGIGWEFFPERKMHLPLEIVYYSSEPFFLRDSWTFKGASITAGVSF